MVDIKAECVDLIISILMSDIKAKYVDVFTIIVY